MKQFFKSIFKGFLTVSLLYLLFILLIVWSKQSIHVFNFGNKIGGWGHTMQRVEEAEKIKGTDILILGSSHAYRGYDNRIFSRHGFSVYNLGSSAQTMFNSYFLLKDHLFSLKPKLIILDSYWKIMENTGAEAAMDLISNSKPTWNLLSMAMVSKDPMVINTFFHSYINRKLHPESFQQLEIPLNNYVSGGYVENFYNPIRSINVASFQKEKFFASDFQVKYFHKIMKLCKENGVDVIVVSTPVVKEYYHSVENYDEYTQLMNRVCGDYNTTFYDFNKRSSFLFSDFYDNDHMTQKGVEKYNNLFINEVLNEKYLSLKNLQGQGG